MNLKKIKANFANDMDAKAFELAVNSKITYQIQKIEYQLEALKLAQANNKHNKLNLIKLETNLSFLWELLSPTEKTIAQSLTIFRTSKKNFEQLVIVIQITMEHRINKKSENIKSSQDFETKI